MQGEQRRKYDHHLTSNTDVATMSTPNPNSSPTGNNNEQVDSLWFQFPNRKPPTPKAAIPIASRAELYYPMSSIKRGRCCVLNFAEFIIDQPKRHGTEHDVAQLVKTFTELGFEMEVKHDLNRRDTKDHLDLITSMDHEKYDCFVLCILSHGDQGIIYCNDGILKVNDILNYFTSSRCPSLTGKPKIFFIQACQGDLFDSGTLVTDSVGSTDSSNTFLIPSYADYLIFYSTYPGYFSFRNAYYGSWFIQDLCTVLKESVHEYDLMTLLTLTSQKIAFNRQSNVPGDKVRHAKKQMPYLVSTLTRLIRFNKQSPLEDILLNEPDKEKKTTGAMKLLSPKLTK